MAYQERVLRERYKTVAEIGRGGMSVVHFAQDLHIGSYWAIKQVKNNSSAEFDAFLKEVELLASLNHSDIPRIVDRIEIGDDYYVVMDFISGTSLSKIVNMEGPQPEDKVIQWGVKIANIMEYLHSSDPAIDKKPVVYRDLKPDNVMLTPAGEIKLIDFGIAREYVPGERFRGEPMGTKGFAAPEQYKGASNMLGTCSDIYSLGATLYYLSTGFLPGPPPKGVPSVRAKNPKLSDAFEYVVAKCTADDPADRYRSFAEVRADLENIERLSGIYRAKMKRRLILFWSSFCLSLVFAVFGWVGYNRVQVDLEDQFQVSYQAAAAYDREADYLNAAKSYAQALRAKPGDRETHMLLFNALLPHGGGANARTQTKAAIDEMRKGYLDNSASPMYGDAKLAYMVVRRCIEVEDAEYANLALGYIAGIKESQEFQEGTMDARELQAFEVIASFQAQNAMNADFEAFDQALLGLEEYTDTADLTLDERLGNYYMLIQMYSTYPSQLKDAYAQANKIGNKARVLLAGNATNESMTFNNIVPMYELLANGQYNSAAQYMQEKEKEQAYRNSIEWFSYLDDLQVDISETLALKKANAYKGLFDIYNTPQQRDRMPETAQTHLNQAIGLYEQILAANGQSFLASVYLTQALYDKEMLRPQEERDFTQTMYMYGKAKAMANSDSGVPSTSIMLYSSLVKLLSNAGLEV